MKKDKKGLEKSTFMEIPAIMRSVTALAFDNANRPCSFHSIAETAMQNGISKFKALYLLISD